MLDRAGLRRGGVGENIFVVKRGKLSRPPLGGSILAGITRDTVLTLVPRAGLDARGAHHSRDELCIADEVFFTGTAAEITPVREVDDRKRRQRPRGPITKRLQDRFFQVVRGPELAHPEWLTFVSSGLTYRRLSTGTLRGAARFFVGLPMASGENSKR